MKPETTENPESASASAHAIWEAIERDPMVAWRSSGKDRYVYRPRQLLIDGAYEDQLAPQLRKEGARRTRLCGTEGKQLEKLGLQQWTLVSRGNQAPEAVDNLRRSLTGVSRRERLLAVTLNHVLGGAQAFRFGPGDLPEDGGPGEVVPKVSKGRGNGKGVQVAILDTGFVPSSTAHPLLDHDYEDDGNDLDKLYDEANGEILSVFGGHGTFIAGIIRQQAPEAELNPEAALDDLDLVDDLELAQDLLRVGPADIVNLSLAGPTKDQLPPPALAIALRYLRENSPTVFVAAAGNDYLSAEEAGQPQQMMWPAAFGAIRGYDHVVGVAAVRRDCKPSDFSNRGPWVKACSFGVKERSTYVKGKMGTPAGVVAFPDATATWSGTSFAAPRVVGAIAATMTASDPPLSPRAALAKLLKAAPAGPSGFGKFID